MRKTLCSVKQNEVNHRSAKPPEVKPQPLPKTLTGTACQTGRIPRSNFTYKRGRTPRKHARSLRPATPKRHNLPQVPSQPPPDSIAYSWSDSTWCSTGRSPVGGASTVHSEQVACFHLRATLRSSYQPATSLRAEYQVRPKVNLSYHQPDLHPASQGCIAQARAASRKPGLHRASQG
ncbi:MAG: hypothetical protein RIS70_3182 [Planctomycetota bacterium]